MKQTRPEPQILIQALILLLSLLLLCSCSEEPIEQDTEPPIRPVRYITMEAGGLKQNRSFSGTAVSGKESSLSFKVSGTIQSLPVKVGDSVTKGTVLAALDPADFEVEYNAAVASLKTSEADAKAAKTAVNTTRSNYNRIEKLYESDNVSLSEFEQARGEFDTAKANLMAAQSRITTAQTQLQAAENQRHYTLLKAPFDGIVNTIAMEENEEITPGATVLTLSGFGNLEVKVNLSDLYISRVENGMKTLISFPSLPGSQFEGVVTEVPYAASEAPTYPVTIQIQTADAQLRPGMAAQVIFSFGQSDMQSKLILPPDAVGEDADGNFVFVIDPTQEGKGTARKQLVSLGTLTEKGFVVLEGISPGQFVATSGLQILLDGMEVKLLKDPVKNW